MIACSYRRDQARKLKPEEYKYLEWASNGTLQLQRLAYQGIKSGKWSRYTGDIPMTESGELLRGLSQAYLEAPRDQEQGPGGPDEKTQGTVVVQAASVASADGSLEAATVSSNTGGAVPTLVPEARNFNPVPGPQSTLGGSGSDEVGRHLHHRMASLGSVPGSVTLGSRTDPVSPVSPLPTPTEPPIYASRNAAVATNETPQQRGTSSSHQVINNH